MANPMIRFRKDDGTEYPTWEAMTLGERFAFKNGINASRDAFRTKGVQCIGVSDVLKCMPIRAKNIIGTVAIDDAEIKRNKVNYGDILFQRSSETTVDIGHAAVYCDDATAVYNGFVICAKPDELFYDPIYLHYSLQYPRVRKQTITLGAGSGQHYNIGQDGLAQIQVMLPSLAEQQKIATLFTELDNLISATSDEVSALEKAKKGMMQKIFSQKNKFKRENHTDYPEWEEKSMGDICHIFAGGTPSTAIQEYWEDGNITWIPSGFIQNCVLSDSNIGKKITEAALCHSSTKMIAPNTTLLAMTGATCGKVAYLTFAACANQSVMAFETSSESSKFIFYLFEYNYDYITSFKAGGAQSGINKESCSNLTFSFPCLEEQQKIAEFLSSMDDAITAARDELEGYKELKKGLLQKMFA